ncbi:MAG: hypothetical protein DWQ30_05860 [Acidobacteria bacterium]|nr:MAG: hypothetical protein DWQ30_05860 [Acidobacteriota bacterium]
MPTARIAVARGAEVELQPFTAGSAPRLLPELFGDDGGPSTEGLRTDVAPERRLELEIGFGKGRFLLRRAAEQPQTSFLGIEIVSYYFRLVARRAARRGLDNLRVLHAEALYALAALLPTGFADAVHVYFPDPWPKARHHKRRLFDAESIDLLVRALKPGGAIFFASDHLPYAALVEQLLRSHPRLEVESLEGWPEGPRTHYEGKFEQQGRPICRLVARPLAGTPPERSLHPAGRCGLLSAWSEALDLDEALAADVPAAAP